MSVFEKIIMTLLIILVSELISLLFLDEKCKMFDFMQMIVPLNFVLFAISCVVGVWFA